MAKMFLMEVDKQGREVEVKNLKDITNYIQCSYIDAVTLFNSGDDRIIVYLDDEGLLVNKKRNRGYAGNILIARVNEEGEDVDLGEEDIKKAIEILEFEASCKSYIIRDFVENITEILPEPVLYKFEYDDINLFLTISSNDIFNSLLKLKDDKTIKLIENIITGIYLKQIPLEEFLEDLSKNHAKFLYENAKENSIFYKRTNNG